MRTFLRLRSLWLFLSLFVFSISGTLKAQSLPVNTDNVLGLLPYQSYAGGDLDSISLTTGQLNLSVPFLSYGQRGALKLSFSLYYNDEPQRFDFWCDPFGNCQYSWGGNPEFPSPLPLEKGDAFVGWAQQVAMLEETVNSDPSNCTGNNNNVPNEVCDYWGTWFVQTADGAQHPLANTGSAYYGGTDYMMLDGGTGPWRAVDATGWDVLGTFTPSASPFAAYPDPSTIGAKLIGPDGVTYGTTEEDPSGNEVTLSGSTLTDSLGRPIPLPPTASSAPNTDTSGCPQTPLTVDHAVLWTVPAPGGGTENYKFCYAKVSVNVAPPQGTGWQTYGETAAVMSLQSIVLPNGQTWGFQYSDTDGTSYNGAPVNYGSLTQVTLPTGGTISYAYTTLDPNTQCGYWGRWVATRTVNADDGSGPHTWSYSYGSGSTTVTDPFGNYTVHTFGLNASGSQGCGPFYETEAEYYQQGGALLKTVNTTYNYASSRNDIGLINVVPATVTSTWPNGQKSQVTYAYDTGFNFTDMMEYTTNGGGQANVGIYGKVATENDYDYGNGSPGPLLKQTNTSWLALSSSNYLNGNLLDLPSSLQINDGSGQEAYTTYAYDQSSLQPSGISTQVDSNPPDGSYRGNLTSVSRWLNTNGSYLTSNTTYYDTGMVYQAKDPLNNPTTYYYSSTYAGAFPTQVTDALGYSTTSTYDFNTGLLASVTDPNSQTTSFSYDSMRRPTAENFPDTGQTTITYQDSSFPLSATMTRKISSSQSYVETNIFDGLGRESQNQVQTGDSQCPTIYTDTAYDALGRKATVSNPYCSTSDATYGVTGYQYDALDRTTQVTMPDNSVSTTTYSGNCTTATDEAGKKRESCVDGLGRLTQVFEDPSGLNYETVYSYDARGNLTGVTQDGGHQRTFSYDSLSRLLTAANPETGTVAYGYDADGNLTAKTDARSITASYSYNAINQFTVETFSNGDPSISVTYGASGCLGAPACYNIERRTGMSDAAGSESWAYDSMGRILEDQRTTNSVTKTAGYLYQPYVDGSLYQLTYPDGKTITYAYNDRELPTSAIDSADGVNYASRPSSGLMYAPHGALTSAVLGQGSGFNGITDTIAYNDRLQPTQIQASSSGGMALDLTYNFNLGSGDNGNVTSITNNLDNTRSQTFTYDSLNRLATAVTASTSGSNCWGEDYGYDSWGNLLSIQAPADHSGCYGENLSLSVNTKNQVTGLSYDTSGDLLSDGTSSYTWNARGEIATAAGLTYAYDGDGRRVEKGQGTVYSYGTGSTTISGSEQSKTIPAVPATGTFSVSWHNPGFVYSGTVTMYVGNATPVQVSYTSTQLSSLCYNMASALAQTGIVTGSCSGSTVKVTADSAGPGGDYSLSDGVTAYYNGSAVNPSPLTVTASGMSGGTSSRTVYDSGTVKITVNGHADSANYGQNDTTSTIATNLANAINHDSSAYVTASASGGALNLTSVPSGQDYSFSVAITYDSTDFSHPSFAASPASGTLSVSQNVVGTLYWRGPGGDVLDETDLSGNLQNEYLYFDGRRVARRDASGNVYYYAEDFLGTSRTIVSSSGATCYNADFYPYGGERGITDSCPQNYKFTGKERDTETGDDYFGARYYAPQSAITGRFLSPDWSATVEPIPYAKLGNPQTLNLYAYVADDPTSFADLDGHGIICLTCLGQAVKRWWSSGVSRDRGTANFARNNAVGAAKGAGTFLLNTVRTVAGVALAAQGNLGTAAAVMTGPAPSALRPSNTTQAQASTATQIALTVGSAVVPGAVAGSAEAATSEVATTTVVHFTDNATADLIASSGQLNAGTFVTLPSEIPTGATSGDIESLLEIGPGKGANSITFDTPTSNLLAPDNGPTTSGGALQFQLAEPQPINPSTFLRTGTPQ